MVLTTNRKVWLKALLFSLASNASVLMVLFYAAWLWPVRLPANSQNIFWLASGVNTAGLLIMGLRWWPILLLNALPAWLLAGEMLDISILGSATNALEALLAAWLIRRIGRFRGTFATTRTLGALILASLVAPLVNTAIIPAWFCLRGVLDWSTYFHAVGNWNLANGAAMLMITPMLVKLSQGGGRLREVWHFWEMSGLVVAAVMLCIVAFNALFSNSSLNVTFLIFPLVIYTAMRFGTREVTVILATVLLGVYVTLTLHAQNSAPARLSSSIWFSQAFCWVLSATGLLVAALSKERQKAESRAILEREKALEISLSEQRSRLEILRYQMHPHFLFNSLNSIYSTLPAEGAGVSRKMLTDLSRFLRATLEDRGDDLAPLRKELQLAHQYLEIERNRFGDELCVDFVTTEGTGEWPVPIFLLQPLVENAIVHGFSASRSEFHLGIYARLENGGLHLEISNTGEWKPGTTTGLGLHNTRKRLHLLYGDTSKFTVGGNDGRVHVRLFLPGQLQSSFSEP